MAKSNGKEPKYRTAAKSITLNGVTFHPPHICDAILGRAKGTTASFMALPVNPLPYVVLPSTVHGHEGQFRYVREDELLRWMQSYASNAEKPKQRGRPRKRT
jgi:hypothetical protein